MKSISHWGLIYVEGTDWDYWTFWDCSPGEFGL